MNCIDVCSYIATCFLEICMYVQLIKIETGISKFVWKLRFVRSDHRLRHTQTHIHTLTHTYIQFILFRKSIYKGTHNFIHFNLSMSLMIGLIIFISGVETAKDNKVVLLLYVVNPAKKFSFI